MKRVNLVGNYKQEVSPCEMEDILVFSKMAHIIPIVRWQFVEDQNGNLILAYRARRIDGIPNVYEILYSPQIGHYLKKIP